MWKRDCEWESPRAPSVRLLFRDERATPALLGFLADTRVGRMPGLALFGVEESESDLEEIALWPEEDGGLGEESEKSGTLDCTFLLFLSFVLFMFLQGMRGSRCPTMTARARPGQEKVI